jgi:hypothetical protein
MTHPLALDNIGATALVFGPLRSAPERGSRVVANRRVALGRQEAPMAHDEARVREFARSYTDAWCSHDPTRVADHFVTGGTIAINGGEPTEVTEVARSFIDAFPDIQVFMDDVVFNDETVEYHWTFTGTNTGPGGTGRAVRITGSEEWTFRDDGLVAVSRGSYDQDEYDRQLEHGAPET